MTGVASTTGVRVMEITEVRIKLMEDSDDRLLAFCSITFDDSFVIRDLKIIEGTNGPFVAMPSRKLTAHCPRCGTKNHLRSLYCNQCGGPLNADRVPKDDEGRTKLYADIAHPINSYCREMIQTRVIAEFREEQELAKEPGYVSRYEDDFEVEFERPAKAHSGKGPRMGQPATEHDAGPSGAVRFKSPSADSDSDERDRRQDRAANQPAPAPHVSRDSDTAPRREATKTRRRNDDFGAGIF